MDFGYRSRDSLPVILNNDTIGSIGKAIPVPTTRGRAVEPVTGYNRPYIGRSSDADSRGATEVCQEFYDTLY